jgi:hypothetical protein
MVLRMPAWLRSLARDRAFTGASLLSLALGIGATTLIFSVVYAPLVQPLPYKDANRLSSCGTDRRD